MKWRSLCSLFAGIILFSTIEVASKVMQSGGGIAGQYPFWLAFLRFIVTGLVLVFPACRQLRQREVRLNRRDFRALAILGLVGVTLMAGFFHFAITLLPANIAALVFSCNPVFVVLFAPLVLAEKITLRKAISAVLCVTGIIILSRDHAGDVSGRGLLLMAAATVFFALYTVFSKKIMSRYGALPLTAFTCLIGGILLLPLAWDMESFPLAAYGAADWLGVAYLSLVGTALGYFLFIYGISHVDAGVGSMVFFLKPFLAALFAWIVLNENLTVPMLLGGLFILGGMLAALVHVPQKRSLLKRTG
ncbi:MAG: hypothetical protein PWQ29_607 [Verrucomicrobiota bacterium]|jgi:drug/metabolite transporter (DMT)-like permease|nr:hypothetical protein [Verrucomicrobiota bacterium]MDK2963213.1 hypothetical protein [Verrucomicrobiota bacterium]